MVEMKERMRLSGLGHRARAPSHGEAPTTDGAHVVAASMGTYSRHNVSQACLCRLSFHRPSPRSVFSWGPPLLH